jgi:ADP-ribose pyrophosphatase YjhB (NUDIX family)
MELNGKAVYFVAVKVFLRDGDKLLLIHDLWGNWELPGGRIKLNEFQQPLVTTVKRKISEELGDKINYSTPSPTGTFIQVSRDENIGDNVQKVQIFAIGFEADYLGGEIDTGDHHDQFKWVDVKTFDPLKLQDNDWMRGVKDYLDKIREERAR